MLKLGFKNTNKVLFVDYSWYFRNALVRANYEDLSKGIYRTEKFLIRFLSTLLLKGSFSLKNLEMHILADTVIDTEFSLIRQDNKITAKEISKRLKMSLVSSLFQQTLNHFYLYFYPTDFFT